MKNPTVSAIIVTYERPELLPRAINSVLKQSYDDFELIIIDNGEKISAKKIVERFGDKRIRYVKTERNLDCAGGKNAGVKVARGDYIAFLDDDDEWMPKKLEIQVNKLKQTNQEVGFSFTAASHKTDRGEYNSKVPDGIGDYHELALKRFNGFLAITLMVKKAVFSDVGLLDESFPSHTEIEWIIRVTKKYKALGINIPLSKVTMVSGHQQMGTDFGRKAKGREMIINKYYDEFLKRPQILAKHFLGLGFFHRRDKNYKKAREAFKKSWQIDFNIIYFFHYLSMFFNGLLYKLVNIFK